MCPDFLVQLKFESGYSYSIIVGIHQNKQFFLR